MTNEKNKTGFLGPAGSFSELAAMQYDRDSECVAFPTISKLLAAFWNKEIDKIILPIENSIEGMVIPSIDNLINGNGKNIIIEGEVELFIMQNLIGIGEKNEIKTVISHPQALAQCANFIEKSGVDIESSDSTSAAVELVAEKKDSSLAAIGTKQAAEIYGLKIIENSIQNSNNNVTRFIVLGHNSKCQTGFDKTSLFFELDNKPGALAIVLIILFLLRINITQIISRPSKRVLGEYVFGMDFNGHRKEIKIKIAFWMIKRVTKSLKFLGSYPKAKII